MNLATLKKCLPYASAQNIAKFGPKLLEAMDEYEINTPRRQAAFLAQIAHESGSLKYVEENLNYSASQLLKVFGKYFTTIEYAERFAHNPEKIANYVYANRMGNGPEESGDGWKYRGRGLIQTSGLTNYRDTSKDLKYDFVSRPDDLKLPGPAAYSAALFWWSRNLNRLADIDAFEKITRVVNGGLNGLDDRVRLWNLTRKALNVEI